MFKIIVFISGEGTTLQYIINSINSINNNNSINSNNSASSISITAVISNRKNAYGLERAKQHNIPTHYLPYIKNKMTREEYDHAVVNLVSTIDHDMIVLAGWMHLFSNTFIRRFPNTINLHPALPNTFPGKNAIEQAYNAFQNGLISYTGCMVHRITEIVDVGEVINTIKVPIYQNDTLNDLKIRIQNYEKPLLMSTISTMLMSPTFLKAGKVRDIYDVDAETLLLNHSDRLSSFDKIICNINGKGNLLMKTSIWWFNKTKHIIDNHYINDYKNYMLVKKCRVIPLEFIVRGYITGSTATSLWTHYAKGVRNYCGIDFPDGLKKNQKLDKPVLTPTTKSDEHDELISANEIVNRGILTQDEFNFISEKAINLYTFGQQEAAKRGLILVDTKYEFGYDTSGNILLIDEIHTCDSSRYWNLDSYQERFEKGEEPIKLDKDSARDYVKSVCDPYNDPIPDIPDINKEKVYECYQTVYSILTSIHPTEDTVRQKPEHNFELLLENLRKQIKVIIFSGSISDKNHVDAICTHLFNFNIPYDRYVCSAHKKTKELLSILAMYEKKQGQKIVIITVAGRSNALSGVAACNSKYPVIACPPFKDKMDFIVNINSTLQCPSNVPVMTILEPGNVALSIKKIFSL